MTEYTETWARGVLFGHEARVLGRAIGTDRTTRIEMLRLESGLKLPIVEATALTDRLGEETCIVQDVLSDHMVPVEERVAAALALIQAHPDVVTAPVDQARDRVAGLRAPGTSAAEYAAWLDLDYVPLMPIVIPAELPAVIRVEPDPEPDPEFWREGQPGRLRRWARRLLRREAAA